MTLFLKHPAGKCAHELCKTSAYIFFSLSSLSLASLTFFSSSLIFVVFSLTLAFSEVNSLDSLVLSASRAVDFVVSFATVSLSLFWALWTERKKIYRLTRYFEINLAAIYSWIFFLSSCWDHIQGGLPGIPTQLWRCPQVRCQGLLRPQVPCTPQPTLPNC